jgi:hypothetical protein
VTSPAPYDELVDAVRQSAAQHFCRIEVSSDEKLPVSASTPDRKRYGFGQTVEEAVTNLRNRPRLSE